MSGKKGGNSRPSTRGMLNKALASKGQSSYDREKNMQSKGSEEHSRRPKGRQGK
jgi:hypothetical protein